MLLIESERTKNLKVVDFWNKKLNKTELCKLILRSLIVPFSSANIMNNSLQTNQKLREENGTIN